MHYTVEPITPEQTRPLRQQLLRQGVPLENLVYNGDLDNDALHVGAFDDEIQIGIATVMRQPPTASVGTPANHPRPGHPQAWRLRGMAVTEDARGAGVGTALLQVCIQHVTEQGGAFLWCDARQHAAGFYRKYGFEVVGEPYTVPDVGPHYFMQRPVEISPAT